MKSKVYLHSQLKNNLLQVLTNIIANVAQLVEHDLAKVGVAGSNLVIRSIE